MKVRYYIMEKAILSIVEEVPGWMTV